MSHCAKKLKGTSDEETKLAGLEALVPEELERHLIPNSNRLRTFEDARLEIVTYVDGKFGLIIRDSKPSKTGARGHSHPMDVDAIILLHLAWEKEKGHQVHEMVCFKCGGAHFQRDCNVHVTRCKSSGKKGTQSKSWPKRAGKGRARNARAM